MTGSTINSSCRWLVACLAMTLIAGCVTPPPAQLTEIDAGLTRAGEYLISQQSDSGAWVSETYGCFKAGLALTPHVMNALFFLPQIRDDALPAYHHGVDYLASFVGEDGTLTVGPPEMLFPVYSAASTSRAVVLADRSPRNLRTQQAWLALLRERQLNGDRGWTGDDPEYGGWGFSLAVPHKPAPGQPTPRFFESNLSATVYGVAAMRSAKISPDDPSFAQALLFATRCQNVPPDSASADAAFDDGGFFFIPVDAVQNKAGPAGLDRFGRERFHSYGTMTADGVRILIRCGLPLDHPRVIAAREWLERNFSATDNPGEFNTDREVIRNGTYYYWAWAVAHAFLALRVEEIETADGPVRWAELLAAELLRRQRSDGSWTNPYTDAKEDDPLVATPFASAALAICRAVIAGDLKAPTNTCPRLVAPHGPR